VYDQERFTVDVAIPPKTPWTLILSCVLGAAVLAGCVVFLLRRARSLRDRDVRGLVTYASRDGRTASLPAGARRATTFRFTVDDDGDVPPTLNIAQSTDHDCYVLTRTRGRLLLDRQGREPIEFQVGDTRPIEEVADIRVVDELRQDDPSESSSEQTTVGYGSSERNPWL
jgi:hypothetical protein